MIDDIFTPEDVANAEDRMRQEAAARARAVSEYDYLRRVEQAARALLERQPIVVDGETMDEWCLYCDATPPGHDQGCWWADLRSVLDTQPRQEGTARHE